MTVAKLHRSGGGTGECPSADPAKAALKPLAPFVLMSGFAVGRAPRRDEIAILAAAGYKSLLNNRPDGESHSPMTSAETAAEAARAGIAYRQIAIEGRNPLEKDVRAFTEALSSMPAPIYAYCHSGGRSAALWALASVATTDTARLIETCAAASYDISGLSAKMDMRRELLADGDDD